MSDRLANGGALALLVALLSLWPLIGAAFFGQSYNDQTWQLCGGVGLVAAVLCWVLLVGAAVVPEPRKDRRNADR